MRDISGFGRYTVHTWVEKADNTLQSSQLKTTHTLQIKASANALHFFQRFLGGYSGNLKV
jgi:hypothetical protein